MRSATPLIAIGSKVPAALRRSAALAAAHRAMAGSHERGVSLEPMVEPPRSRHRRPAARPFKHPGRVAIVAVTLLVVAEPVRPAQRARHRQNSGTNLPARSTRCRPKPGAIVPPRIDHRRPARRPHRRRTRVCGPTAESTPRTSSTRSFSLNTISFPARARQGVRAASGPGREPGGRPLLGGPARRPTRPDAGTRSAGRSRQAPDRVARSPSGHGTTKVASPLIAAPPRRR